MKNLFLLSFAIVLTFLISCGEGSVVIAVDPAIQRAADVAIIEEYLTSKGYDPSTVDTTESGVRYVILDEGQTAFDSLSIDESDIVDFDYIGRLTDDKLFDTTIESVTQEDTAIFTDNRVFIPILINYSSTGWTISGRFITGFTDGVSTTFNKVHVGGRILIILPSDIAYGGSAQFSNGIETIPANSVITFELQLVRVTKQ
ncbi:MAG: FKBP-type peptidyl-prolyl cis-trans isomerase [Cyclobacteriaceae bacterium]